MERGEAKSARVQRAIAFLAAVAIVVGLALRGGTYDIVDRQALGLLVWWILAVALALGIHGTDQVGSLGVCTARRARPARRWIRHRPTPVFPSTSATRGRRSPGSWSGSCWPSPSLDRA